MEWQIGFEVVGDPSAGFVDAADDVDRGLEAGGGRGFAHQADHGIQGIKEHSLAGAADMGKEAAFDGVVLGAVAWVVGHADGEPQFIDEALQVLFEQVLRCSFSYIHKR